MTVWFITGCSSGIGKGIAKAVLKSGENNCRRHSTGQLSKTPAILLGTDAVKIVSTELEDRLQEIKNWDSVSIQTDY